MKQRLILEIFHRGKATVNDLSDGCPDIPRSTIYRHMAKLEKEEVVLVTDMVRKRGAMEKTYVLNKDLFGKEGEQPSNELISVMFSQFCLGYLEKCRAYLEKHDSDDPLMLTFASSPFYATDSEVKIFMERLGMMLSEMVQHPPAEDRKLYSFGTLLMPAEDASPWQ